MTDTERSNMIESLSPLATDALVKLLAGLTAPFLAVRRDVMKTPAVYAARKRVLAEGIRQQDTGDGAQRKALHRARGELVAAGLIRPGTKMNRFHLTPDGRRLARSAAWSVDSAQTTEAIRRLKVCTLAKDYLSVYDNEKWVPEIFLSGTPWGPHTGPLFWLAHCMAAFSADGLVESHSSVQGHVCYRLTRVPENIDKFVECACDWSVPFNDDLADLYLDEVESVRDRIDSDRTHYSDIGAIPLRMTNCASGRQIDDLSGIEPLFPQLEDLGVA